MAPVLGGDRAAQLAPEPSEAVAERREPPQGRVKLTGHEAATADPSRRRLPPLVEGRCQRRVHASLAHFGLIRKGGSAPIWETRWTRPPMRAGSRVARKLVV